MTVNLSFGLKVANKVFPKPLLPTDAEYYILPQLEVMVIKILNLVQPELIA